MYNYIFLYICGLAQITKLNLKKIIPRIKATEDSAQFWHNRAAARTTGQWSASSFL